MTADDALHPGIRTPDQRLRVFVSSTLAELAEERAAVARAITALRLSPVMFELGARPHPPQELYRAYLAQSDIFIGLYWQSYGWVGPGMEISGLEDELQLSAAMPRLLYLRAPAPERDPRLQEMISEIRSQASTAYRTFRGTRELGTLVRDDLAVLLSERFVAPGQGAAAIAQGAPDAAPIPQETRSLPVTSTSLIGRDDDVDAVTTMLGSEDVRLVTLTGSGGIGKTRLAIAIGEEWERRGNAPVVFVPLAAITEPSTVVPRIAAAAGVLVEGSRSARDALVDRFAARPTVLVLDNLEHLATAAQDLEDLLTHAPGLRILATSRTVLRLRAEHEFVVGPLTVPAASADLAHDDAAGFSSVRLFLDRARAVRRGFALTPESTAAVVEICRRLDGVPLAIELAAARTRLLDPVSLLGRLTGVLDALGTGPVDLPERQRTLRATVEWSMGLLSDQERSLLQALSVFADGWTIPAAAAISDESEDRTLDLLDALAGHSLVSVDATGGEPRFRMLASVREFAAERSDAAEVARRHAQYFAAVVEAEAPAEQVVGWMERIRADEENVRVAIRWFFDHDLPRLPHLLRTLWMFWQVHDGMAEAGAWARELQRSVGPSDLDEHAADELLFIAAVTATEVGNDETALAALDAIQRRIPQVGDQNLRNMLNLAVAWIVPILGDVDGSLAAGTAAYAGFAEDQDPFLATAALTVGLVQMLRGESGAARRYFLEVDEIGSRFGVQWLTVSARSHLAMIDVLDADLDSARVRIRHALDGLDESRTTTVSACLILTAFVHLSVAAGDHTAAATTIGATAGLRSRAEVRAWPVSRPGEESLRAGVQQALTPSAWDSAYAAGYDLRMGDALAYVRARTDAAVHGIT